SLGKDIAFPLKSAFRYIFNIFPLSALVSNIAQPNPPIPMSIVPYKDRNEGKKEQVANMFDNISKRYDLLDHGQSMGIDVIWRKKAIGALQAEPPKLILDRGTGTADFAIEDLALNPDRVIGVDISEGMLAEGGKKVMRKKLDHL